MGKKSEGGIVAVFIPDLAPFLAFATNIFSSAPVMGKLGEFPFYMHKNDYKQIARARKSDFSEYKPIKGQALTGDSGGTSQTIRLNGVLIAEPTTSLVGLENMLLLREPIRFTTMDYDFECVITDLDIVDSNFYLYGDARVSRYSISLKEIYGEIV